jgi:hypothetical protein
MASEVRSALIQGKSALDEDGSFSRRGLTCGDMY